jgi:hypothetical protein
MQHLMLETIGRLVDEAASAEEAAHLEQCDACRTELETMRADVAALANLPMIEPPPTEWEALEKRLLEEGLVRRRASARAPWLPAMIRTAASIAIFAIGAATGIAWTRNTGDPGSSVSSAVPFAGVESQSSNGNAVPLVAVREPRSSDETLALYRQAEAVYLDALTRVGEMSTGEAGDPFARLAALESIAAITRSALAEAPADPVLNGYHLTALAQKEATLRQIAATRPGRWF